MYIQDMAVQVATCRPHAANKGLMCVPWSPTKKLEKPVLRNRDFFPYPEHITINDIHEVKK